MMRKSVTIIAMTLLATPAVAHTGAGETSGLVAGLTHPVYGVDHLLAMLAVGLWSGFVLPEKLWAGAAVFLCAMFSGALLSWTGIALPVVETGILASVILFGLLLLGGRRGQDARITVASLVAIGLFAAFHGYAHATEAHGNIAAYLTGFLISTAALHAAGIGIASAAGRIPAVQSLLGAGITGAGLWLAFG